MTVQKTKIQEVLEKWAERVAEDKSFNGPWQVNGRENAEFGFCWSREYMWVWDEEWWKLEKPDYPITLYVYLDGTVLFGPDTPEGYREFEFLLTDIDDLDRLIELQWIATDALFSDSPGDGVSRRALELKAWCEERF